MNSRFSVYDGRPNARAVGPQISVSKDGRFALNKVASAIFDKEVVEKVILGWDAAANQVALQKITKKDPRARTVRYAKDGRGAAFNAKDFLENFVGYDLSKGRSFPAEWDAEEGTLTFQIEGSHLAKSRRNPTNIVNVKRAQQS